MYEDRYGFLWWLTYDNRGHRFDPKTETFEQGPAAGEEGSAFLSLIHIDVDKRQVYSLPSTVTIPSPPTLITPSSRLF